MGETGKRSRSQGNKKDISDDGKYQKRRFNDNDGANDDKYQKKGNDGELVVYRILCPDGVIGSVIGKNGKVINSLRQETGARIKVVDPFPGTNDRVITIYCYVKGKNENEIDENDTKPHCAAQDALLKVHSTIASAVSNFFDSGKEAKEEARMLVPTSQVSKVIGKSGSVIKKLRAQTKADIKVTPKDSNDPAHAFAMSFDNIVQITGEAEAVNKALFAVSTIMYRFSPKEEITLETTVPEQPSIIIPSDMPIYPAGGVYPGADAVIPPTVSIPPLLPVPEVHNSSDGGSAWPMYSSALPVVPAYSDPSRSEELVVRLLCPNDKLGRVIGKGGSSIKSVRQESGARVEIGDPKADSDECLVTVTSTEYTDDVKSNAVEAVLLLQGKINDNDADDTVSFRMLFPAKAVGCLIGKSGSIINEMRKSTKADIRISKGKKPKCAPDDDQLIEILGEVSSVRDALLQIVLRLRDFILKDKDGVRGVQAGDPILSGGPRSNHATDSLYSSTMRSAPVSDSFYPSSARVASAADSLYPSNFSGPSLSGIPSVTPLSYEHRVETSGGLGMHTSSSLYRHDSLQPGGENNGYGSVASYSSRTYSGLSSTIELVIPANAVGKVMGKGGANLLNIQKISGAVVEILESKSSRLERVAHISGTSEQRRSAENLIQAFVLST